MTTSAIRLRPTPRRRLAVAATLAALALAAAPAGAAETVVTLNGSMNCTHPQWSPDGAWILYHATKPTDSSFHQIRKVRPDGTDDMMVVSNSTLRLGSARWSPVADNGSSPRYWIAYAADDPTTSGSGRIYVARDKNPGELTVVSRQRTTDPFPGRDHGAPRFSADGSYVVFEYSAAPGAGRVAAYRAYSSILFETHGASVASALPKDAFPIAMERADYAQNGELLGDTAVRRPVPSPDGLFVAGVRQKTLDPVERRVQRIHPMGHAFGYPDDQNTIDVSSVGVIDPADPFTIFDVVDASEAEWRPVASETYIVCTIQVDGESDTEIAWYPPADELGTLVTRNSVDDRSPVWGVGHGAFGCRFIAFVRESVYTKIWVVHQDPADGEFEVSVSNTNHDNPAWDPADFTKVAYQKQVLGKWQIAWNQAFCPIHN